MNAPSSGNTTNPPVLTFKLGQGGHVPRENDIAARTILPIVACFPNGRIEMIGTGFLVAGRGKRGLMLTAKHVVDAIADGSRRTQSHPSMPREFLPQIKRLHKTAVYALMPLPDGSTHALAVTKYWGDDGVDISACCVLLPNLPDELVFKNLLGINTTPNVVGTPVMLWGFTGIDVSISKVRAGHVKWKTDVRRGVITEAFKQGEGACRHIGFRTTLSIDSCMSGTPIWDISTPKEMVICGLASTDFNDPSDPAKGAGDSSVAELWPAMRIKIDANWFGLGNEGELIRLLELEKKGLIKDIGRASEHVRFDDNYETGKSQVSWTGELRSAAELYAAFRG